MSDPTLPTGPDPEAIITCLTTTYPETDIVTIPGPWFFSLDAEKHWPNYATIVTTDEHDMGAPSNLSKRPNAFRLNLGVDKATFERVAADPEPDYAALDRVLPHPVYADQRWISTQPVLVDLERDGHPAHRRRPRPPRRPAHPPQARRRLTTCGAQAWIVRRPPSDVRRRSYRGTRRRPPGTRRHGRGRLPGSRCAARPGCAPPSRE